MSKPKILLQLDSDPQPSVFDAVVALDAGVDQLLRHGGMTPETVRELVYGVIFTRGPEDLHHTAIFVGGSDVSRGEALVKAVEGSFLGPLRVSVLLDANGANTTAAAAVLAAEKHSQLADSIAVVLGGTGPVGRRAVHLLARAGAAVRVGSRNEARAAEVCAHVSAKVPNAMLSPCGTAAVDDVAATLVGAHVVIAAGAAGVELLSKEARDAATALRVAVDLNAVPPVGIAGVKPHDSGNVRDGIACYGAIGVGGVKMKIHKQAIRQLFESNAQVLDAEEVFEIGRQLES
ncbi:MAG: bifunctional NADP-dependent methylenetetrahydromethanopterin dehydrogenase/methylenetetrahydrofolate dehydrogenase [Pirellulales bacterium]|nr:bifunctional NADP-dependent methylenetetrahydromethanopterin dehydrogenase/methylenetetrahydrofolate dehydrogenase [Pirellulales bacterium]